ncbi:coniferyl aldehyde dehydrogenase [Celeribacter persicus]|jgi:NAD-dependent aldehyde dehydrogenases|uniref:Aldehyde dehydrogenase n=1 Tax=Celeribacter persicus TaxID=1651082 RepID=A0A2T5HS47_9RHOB|nr:coniferyl aldehyde dehydrogenase [Celeribacter persicus]PTQ74399.1 coniferyl-aldehyde dehydrogenase [Celeribacter persicus]
MTSEPEKTFARQKAVHRAVPVVSLDIRLDRLNRLATALLASEARLITAMSDDFSHRPAMESRLYDIDLVIGEIRHAKRHLKRWMRTRRAPVPLIYKPARAEIRPQPLGVVGIISPWNFPVQLALAPMVAALAAGNRVMLKPSELTPRTSEELASLIEDTFTEEEVATITGGPEVAAAFSALPFDHLFFTGSTAVGRKVAEAAARNLTPVTLELGGKSPAVIMPGADLDKTGRRIAWGKAMNAGQVCIAPDYVLVPRKKMLPMADAIMGAFMRFFPQGPDSPDYAAIVSDRHLARLDAMVKEAEARGAKILRLEGDIGNARKFTPTVVLDPPADIALMQEEIFGPILPLIPYDDPQEALDFVAARDHPLALYVFSEDKDEQNLWLDRSISGGVTVNDTAIHVGFGTLPFGGIGTSGQGAYHGRAGFETFSHLKPVVRQAKWNGMAMAEPPFRGWRKRALGMMRKLM